MPPNAKDKLHQRAAERMSANRHLLIGALLEIETMAAVHHILLEILPIVLPSW